MFELSLTNSTFELSFLIFITRREGYGLSGESVLRQ